MTDKPKDQKHSGLIIRNIHGKGVYAKSYGQGQLIKAIEENSVIFVTGPAGSGKSYLSIAMAIQALKEEKYQRLLLTRPVVESGESLGFLPGDLEQKIDPYMRPLYDAIDEFLKKLKVTSTGHKSKKDIPTDQEISIRDNVSVCPLAYMRGRSFNDSFIILDEGQNSTIKQMKMFLSRMGYGSKMIITGDTDQIDLQRGVSSGMKHAIRIMEGVPGIAIVKLGKEDIVRHPLVAEMLSRYEKDMQDRE